MVVEEVTVEQLANDVGISEDLLREQLSKAGIKSEDSITLEQKTQLLDYLKHIHIAGSHLLDYKLLCGHIALMLLGIWGLA